MNWNPTEGKERVHELPPFWPPKEGARPESGVAGRVVEFSSYRAKDDDGAEKIVPSVILADAVTYVPAGGSAEVLTQAGEVTVTISAGLRHVLAPRKTPIGSVISLVYKGTDPTLNNMKVFKVFDHTEHYLTTINNAARMTSRGARG